MTSIITATGCATGDTAKEQGCTEEPDVEFDRARQPSRLARGEAGTAARPELAAAASARGINPGDATSVTRSQGRVKPSRYKAVQGRPPATPINIAFPADHLTIKAKRLDAEAREIGTEAPAAFETVILEQIEGERHMTLRSIPCKTNCSPDVIRKFETTLLAKRCIAVSIDGCVGPDTMNAVNACRTGSKRPADTHRHRRTLKHQDLPRQ